MSLYKYWRRFNEELAVQVVALVATMECVYAFAAFVLIPLWFPQTTPFVQYVSSALLQLTFLPLILVAQEVSNRRERTHSEAEHRALMKEIKALRALIVNPSKDSTHAS
jgi:hypothetical protein